MVSIVKLNQSKLEKEHELFDDGSELFSRRMQAKAIVDEFCANSNKRGRDSVVFRALDLAINSKSGEDLTYYLPEGRELFRARTVSRKDFTENKGLAITPDGKVKGFDEEYSMEAPLGKPKAGRNNIAGMSYLYLSEDVETACDEMKAKAGTFLSVAKIQIKEKLKLLNLSAGLYATDQVPDRIDYSQIYSEIVTRFYSPTQSSDEYEPTQLISNYIRKMRFDGVAFYSAQNTRDSSRLHMNYTIFNNHPSYFHFEDSSLFAVKNDNQCYWDYNAKKLIESASQVDCVKNIDPEAELDVIRNLLNADGNTKGYSSVSFKKETQFLVTGGAGFIGSNLCEALLKKGCRVRCLDNLSTGKKENINAFLEDENFEFIEGDIRNLDICIEACKGVDYVLHEAAWGSVPRSIEMPLFYCENNIMGMLNMLEASRKNNVKRFVYASSSSVYGDEKVLPKEEGIEGNLLSPYALTKRCDEEWAKQYTMHYGLETIGLRYFNVFGRRQNPDGAYAAVIPKFIKLLLKDKRPTINGDGEQSRDFTYIENVIEANLKACTTEKEASGRVYNVAYGGSERLIDVYHEISDLLDKTIEPEFGPDRAGDIKHSNADISGAKEYLGYEPEWDFKKGIREAIGWYVENLL